MPKDKRVMQPYSLDRLPRDVVFYADFAAAHVALKSAERAGNQHKIDRAAKRIRQLEAIRELIENRTCKHCFKRFKSVFDRKVHEGLNCKVRAKD